MDNSRKFALRVRFEIADRLQTDFVKQRPLYINLLDDLGSVDSFIIDGDALLLECVANPHNDLRHGGQPLYLIYLIEIFIYSLKNCLNACFSFVFFENHASIWEGDAFLRLTRRTLQHHLKCLAHQSTHAFPSWHSEEWLKFVSEKEPAFLLMSDMEGPALLSEQHRSEDLAHRQFPGGAFSEVGGVKACAHLLKEASVDQAGSSEPRGFEANVKMCWAWCLQHAACSVLLLEQRSVNVERLETAAAANNNLDRGRRS